jgi:hypothetical protein
VSRRAYFQRFPAQLSLNDPSCSIFQCGLWAPHGGGNRNRGGPLTLAFGLTYGVRPETDLFAEAKSLLDEAKSLLDEAAIS